MSIDPDVIRAEPHGMLGRLIQTRAPEIIDRWQYRAVEEQPHAEGVHRRALLDHLPELLKAIGDSLESNDGQATSHARVAGLHGEQRWETGWSLKELVRDYQILRLVLMEFVEETLGRPMSSREVMAMGLVLDEAISFSVDVYIKNREEQIRNIERDRQDRERQAQRQFQEMLLTQAEALRAADRKKNEFFALLGHELRNPLSAMANALELAHLLDPDHPDRRQAAEIVRRQLRHMERLVDDLLDVTRIGRGLLELRLEPTELAAAATQAVASVRALVDTRSQKLAVVLPAEPVWANADPARLQQILSNLLVNAAKYTPPGGRIWFALERQDASAVLRITDNGVGIAPELLPRIFDMFMQGDRTGEHIEGGLGLGLTLVRSLVELHGGSVEVSSQGVGQGSTFAVLLPAVAAPAVEPASGKVLDAPSRVLQIRVLVVDDNQDVANMMAALLRHAGHDVRLAHDGPTAIEMAGHYRPDMVLVDIGLPGMSGYEVARQLRQQASLEHAVLAALTGFGQEEDRRRSAEAGFDHHLVKPVQPEVLKKLLAQVVPADQPSSPNRATGRN